MCLKYWARRPALLQTLSLQEVAGPFPPGPEPRLPPSTRKQMDWVSSHSAVFLGTVKGWLPSHLAEGLGLGGAHCVVRTGMPSRKLVPSLVALPWPLPTPPKVVQVPQPECISERLESRGEGQYKEGRTSGTSHPCLPSLPAPARPGASGFSWQKHTGERAALALITLLHTQEHTFT